MSDPLESTTAPLPIPADTTTPTTATTAGTTADRPITSPPPLDPSKLNHTPAPLPTPDAPTLADPTAPLRSPESGPHDSAYLDTGLSESPSHPTVAETGTLSPQVSRDGPGPKQGQLKRVEVDKGSPREIIKLGSFGGEGLEMKPPVGSPTAEGGPLARQ